MKLLELKSITQKYNLRVKKESKEFYISPTRSKVNPHDHLYDGFISGYGLAIRRDSIRSFNAVRKQVEKLGAVAIQIGDMEGNFKVSESLIPKLAVMFKFKKKAIKPPLSTRKQHESSILLHML